MAMVIEDKIFESEGLAWAVEGSVGPHPLRTYISYPMCPTKKCHVRLHFGSSLELECPNCKRKLAISKNIEELRTSVDAKFQGSKTWDAQVINLDLLPTAVSAREEDENYWVQVKLGQKDGKRMAVVYIGEKKQEGKKAQLFVDVDDEQMRFDKGDQHPTSVVTMLVAHFPTSKHTVERKQ